MALAVYYTDDEWCLLDCATLNYDMPSTRRVRRLGSSSFQPSSMTLKRSSSVLQVLKRSSCVRHRCVCHRRDRSPEQYSDSSNQTTCLQSSSVQSNCSVPREFSSVTSLCCYSRSARPIRSIRCMLHLISLVCPCNCASVDAQFISDAPSVRLQTMCAR